MSELLASLKCRVCGKEATRSRQSTAYVDDELNYDTLCEECQEIADEYWEYKWKEYYSSL